MEIAKAEKIAQVNAAATQISVYDKFEKGLDSFLNHFPGLSLKEGLVKFFMARVLVFSP